MAPLAEYLPAPGGEPDAVLDALTAWARDRGLTLYPAQEEALLAVLAGDHVIVNTPTGSGKSLIALGAHAAALVAGQRSCYTAPIKALVSEKFFDLCAQLGSDNVGMATGDASVNPDAPVICCTAEILANRALRHGANAGFDQVVMDEFHFYADPDRGWAWQVPLLEMRRSQFVLMSATLGDVTRFVDDLRARTGKETAVVRSATRPIPLAYRYAHTLIHDTIDELLAGGEAPVYVVHFTQAAAVTRAQALTSVTVAPRSQRDAIAEAIGSFRFAPGFGRTLSRFIRHGIGVHHAGMLPKYRRLVERLAQEGLLNVICGTDTLGVGINVPIRTVLFTGLSKYDGTISRLLSAREFHQIAGRAGRAGFDDAGTVVVQAPEHVIENEKAVAKAGDDAKKRRKIVRAKPPKGFVPWTEDTFNRLVDAPPEPLQSSFAVSHAMLLNVLDRPGDGCAALKELLVRNHEPRPAQRRHIRRAIAIYRSLLAAGVVERLPEPDEVGRRVRVTVELQEDFALNQPLSPFVLEALPRLDPTSELWPLDVVSVVESTLENPGPILAAQLERLRSEVLGKLKADGVEYEERMETLRQLEWPKPLRDFLYELFDTYRVRHPWAADHNVAPKSVVRDLYGQAMTFPEYVAHYGIARSEGLLLRYLSDAYKGLTQTVPEDAKNDDLRDLTEWLGELVRQTDSSLLDEWELLRNPAGEVAAGAAVAGALGRRGVITADTPPPVTANRRAFGVMVRNACFRRVELASRHDWDGLAEAEAEAGGTWDAARWSAALAPYFGEHGRIEIGPAARAAALWQLDERPAGGGSGRHWVVRQVIDDPAGDHDWGFTFDLDLDASDELGAPALRVVAIGLAGS
jgi:superfamily II RNA helicase